MNCYEYMVGTQYTGFKLCNLQYRNEVDTDNRYKIKTIYPIELDYKDALDCWPKSDGWYKRRMDKLRRDR